MSAFSIIPRFPLGGKMGECSLYETATQEVITMYNDEFNNNDMYRFTNREVPRDDYAPAPRQENTYTAPVSVHTVLLTDNGDERLCPREDAGNHSRP